MEVVQAAEAAQSVAESGLYSVDWRSVAIMAGAIIGAGLTFIMAICGWVWISTMGWMRKISEEFTQHVKDDNVAFGQVKQMIYESHTATLSAIANSRVVRVDDEKTERR